MRKFFFFLSMMFCVNMVFAQTATLSLGTVYDPAAGPVSVPLTLDAIDNPNGNSVSGFALYFKYNASVLGNTVTFNSNPFWTNNGPLVTNVIFDNPEPGWNTVAFVYATGGLLTPDPGLVFTTMTFNYSAGQTGLIWADTPGFLSYLVDYDGNEYLLTTNNGFVGSAGYDVTFHVTDNSTGADLEGAEVAVETPGGTLTETTDIDGNAVFNLPNGTYSYTVTLAGYIIKTGSFTVNGAPITIPIALNCVGCTLDVTFKVTSGGNDLEGVLVTVGSETAVTNALGEAVIPLPDGNYSYTAEKYGYVTQSDVFTVAGANLQIDVDMPMLPHYEITFHVKSGGNNLEGASIDIDVAGVETITTDIDGMAVFNLIDGTYNYTITKSGFETKTGSFDVLGAAFTIEENLNQLWDVTFHSTADGADLEGVAITVGAQTLISNSNGLAVFALPNGNYSYTATKAGYVTVSGNFTVSDDILTIEVPMVEIQYEITFHVSDPVGTALEGALVELDNGQSGTTNSSGNAIFMLADGEYVYTVSKAGYGTVQDLLLVSGTSATLEIELIPDPTYTVTFTITNSAGAPLEGADVTIGSDTVTTGANGLAIFNLVNGEYEYSVTLLGYITQTGNFLVVNAPEEITIIMELTEWPIIFHVTEAGTGTPVIGATVTIQPGNIIGITGAGGLVTINLANGAYTYTVDKTGYNTATDDFDVLNSGATIDVEIILTVWVATFHVISTTGPIANAAVTCNGETKLTNANGDALFDLPDGSYPYTVTKDGYVPNSGTAVVNGAPVPVTVFMIVQKVTVNVTNQLNQPLPGAEVTLNGFPPQTTPANGTVIFSVVPNGTHPLTVTHPDYDTYTDYVEVNGASVVVNVGMFVGYEELNAGSFSVYPNPSSGTFNLSASVDMGYESDVTIYDFAGQLVYTGKLIGNEVNVIDLSAQEKGTYIMQIIVEDKVYNKTLVIQ